MANPSVEKYGWTAVPRKVELLLQLSEASGPAKPILVSSMKLPNSTLVQVVKEYAQKELAIETFNHSMRVYYYGLAPLNTRRTKAYPKLRTSHSCACVSLLGKPILQ